MELYGWVHFLETSAALKLTARQAIYLQVSILMRMEKLLPVLLHSVNIQNLFIYLSS